MTSSLLKRVFGGQPDNVLRPVREVLKGQAEEFPLAAIRSKFKGTTRSLTFTKEDVDSLLESRYGQGYAFSVLALLYPTLDFRNTFHIDHIYPRSQFTWARLAKRGISGDDAGFCLEHVDLLPNLQLLEGIPNQEKNDSDFDNWLTDKFKNKQARQIFMDKNYIPTEINLEFDNFREFFDERRQQMFSALSKLLKAGDE